MSNQKITPEILDKMETCKSAEELVKIAGENNVRLSLDEAKKYLSKDNVKLSKEDLDKVSGGMPPIPPDIHPKYTK